MPRKRTPQEEQQWFSSCPIPCSNPPKPKKKSTPLLGSLFSSDSSSTLQDSPSTMLPTPSSTSKRSSSSLAADHPPPHYDPTYKHYQDTVYTELMIKALPLRDTLVRGNSDHSFYVCTNDAVLIALYGVKSRQVYEIRNGFLGEVGYTITIVGVRQDVLYVVYGEETCACPVLEAFNGTQLRAKYNIRYLRMASTSSIPVGTLSQHVTPAAHNFLKYAPDLTLEIPLNQNPSIANMTTPAAATCATTLRGPFSLVADSDHFNHNHQRQHQTKGQKRPRSSQSERASEIPFTETTDHRFHNTNYNIPHTSVVDHPHHDANNAVSTRLVCIALSPTVIIYDNGIVGWRGTGRVPIQGAGGILSTTPLDNDSGGRYVRVTAAFTVALPDRGAPPDILNLPVRQLCNSCYTKQHEKTTSSRLDNHGHEGRDDERDQEESSTTTATSTPETFENFTREIQRLVTNLEQAGPGDNDDEVDSFLNRVGSLGH